MKNLYTRTIIFLNLLMIAGFVYETTAQDTITTIWKIDNVTSINGFDTEINGNPLVSELEWGNAVAFDGVEDQIIVKASPLKDYTEFTIEAIFYPNDIYAPGSDNLEPRFIHIEDIDDADKRVTMELRLNDSKQWYFDGFIKSPTNSLALIDENLVHPVEEWQHAALTYKDGKMTTYVNGDQELSGDVTYSVIENGQTSIGSRLNFVHYLNGSIAQLRVTDKMLSPSDFMLVDEFLSGNDTATVDIITHITQKKRNTVWVSPNPVQKNRVVSIRSSQFSQDASIKIYDITGKSIMLEKIESGHNGITATLKSGIKPGLYIAVVNNKGQLLSAKFMVN